MNRDNIEKSALYKQLAEITGRRDGYVKQYFNRNKFDIRDTNNWNHYIGYVNMKKGGLYCLVNSVNGRTYIGKTTCFYTRKAKHFQDLKKDKHYAQLMQEDYNTMGNVFMFKIIYIYDDINGLSKAERKCIHKFNSEYNSEYTSCFSEYWKKNRGFIKDNQRVLISFIESLKENVQQQNC